MHGWHVTPLMHKRTLYVHLLVGCIAPVPILGHWGTGTEHPRASPAPTHHRHPNGTQTAPVHRWHQSTPPAPVPHRCRPDFSSSPLLGSMTTFVRSCWFSGLVRSCWFSGPNSSQRVQVCIHKSSQRVFEAGSNPIRYSQNS